MQDVKLFTQLLGIADPRSVESVDFDKVSGEVRIRVSMSREGLVCPECGESVAATTRRCRNGDTSKKVHGKIVFKPIFW